LLVGLLALCATSTCMRQPDAASRQRSTGTCQGACDYYQACKRDDDQQRWGACISECSDFFAGEQALREFERMECTDVISFVEGSSGHGPGDHSSSERPSGHAAN
jgi:hypothetical protein